MLSYFVIYLSRVKITLLVTCHTLESAHNALNVRVLDANGSHEQKLKYLPGTGPISASSKLFQI